MVPRVLYGAETWMRRVTQREKVECKGDRLS